ncbi:glycosyltransferase [Sediminitomix flava]|uniref:Cellulose synthase/poly-beta-1,6-N-acetylglucosamine synthase-like glycosyltransferase n=1 Tax=Sediminitomix flava TaxID=379075 RepID=A0A315ZAJ4_SEDFL|nr:glycosyltransferase [Sediminitomix flava]PWJ42370.1 cellulose synthase/poly-beta-1,6-N-acetylglucosamine synthase-like glycosyltransferase [Sediminitomix flava]
MFYLVGWSLLLCYIIVLLIFIFTWHFTKEYESKNVDLGQALAVSVVIPIRNEEDNIIQLLTDLQNQTYTNFEVIIVNDNSTDRSIQLVEEFKKYHSLKFTVLNLPQKVRISHKKAAIELALKYAVGDWIQLTDGDCNVQPKWLEQIVSFQLETKAKLISAGVIYKIYNFWTKLLAIEFLSPVGVGAIGMLLKKPSMCNGANLGFLKSIFYEVDGYKGNENLSSGDDEFLMHKVAKFYPEKVFYLKSKEAIVKTDSPSLFIDFVHQRIRWASKWKNYDNLNSIIAGFFVFCFHLYFVVSICLSIIGFVDWEIIVQMFLLRVSIESMFLGALSKDFYLNNHTWTIPIIAIFYSFYVIIIAVVSLRGKYSWKGRKIG